MKPQLNFYHVIWKIRNLENFEIFEGFEACISNIIHKKYSKVKQPNVVYIYMTWSTSVLCIGPSVSTFHPIWSVQDSHLCSSPSLSESVRVCFAVRFKIFWEVQTLFPGISHNIRKYRKPQTLSDSRLVKVDYPFESSK